MGKKVVGIFFGGRSAEHEISMLSATSIMEAIPKSRYSVVAIGVRKDGGFVYYPGGKAILHGTDASKVRLAPSGIPVTFQFGKRPGLIALSNKRFLKRLDVVFPVLHGTYGEDGTMQGLLEIAGLPYVGPGVLGSAIGMDKDVTKRLWRDAGLPIADFLVARSSQKNWTYAQIIKKLGTPFFVKPAVAGSSVGVHKVTSSRQFVVAMRDAFSYCEKVLIERMVQGREIECSVLGGENPKVSLPGAVIPTHSFYSYEAKYLDPDGAQFEIPARMAKASIRLVQDIVRKAYVSLGLEGMARVDGFLDDAGVFTLNEVNTIPGFTKISMYPKLWKVSGFPFPDLLDRLLQDAMDRYARGRKLKTGRL